MTRPIEAGRNHKMSNSLLQIGSGESEGAVEP